MLSFFNAMKKSGIDPPFLTRFFFQLVECRKFPNVCFCTSLIQGKIWLFSCHNSWTKNKVWQLVKVTMKVKCVAVIFFRIFGKYSFERRSINPLLNQYNFNYIQMLILIFKKLMFEPEIDFISINSLFRSIRRSCVSVS